MSIRGSVDSLTTEGAVGWAFDSRAGEQLVVQAIYDGRILGEAEASQHRHDLAEAGFGDGRCGFAISFYEAVDPSVLPFVSVRPRGGDVELPRYALTGFGEYFRGLHARHPGAGRHRSVLGGLWTDRTDAAALVAGRIAAGTLPAEAGAPLVELVTRGHAVLRGALPEARPDAAALEAGRPVAAEGEGRDFLEALAGFLFQEAALLPLRGALDDQPTVTRVVPVRGIEPGFAQGSTAEALPSPAECLVLAVPGPRGAVLDVVRGSHALPEFTADGRSRWLHAGIGAAQELALNHGLSVEQLELAPRDLAILGAGTLHRLRLREGTALRAWVLPRRVTPMRFLTGEAGSFTLRHATGAMLAA